METTKKTRIAIIGLGPRGLGVLERLICNSQLQEYAHVEFEVYLIEPNLPGAGVHHIEQKEYMFLNTPTELPTLFPGNIFGNSILAREGLSFSEWGNQVWKNSNPSIDFLPDTYLPRSLMGEYLNWVFNEITKKLPKNLNLNFVNAAAESIDKNADTYNIYTNNNQMVSVENIFLTIGQADRAELKDEDPYIVSNPYPIDKKLKIKAGDNIVLNGMGLVAFDIMLELTIGRGGHFFRNANGDLEYKKSQLEPQIYIFSKSGIPYRARPIGQSPNYLEPIVLTRQEVKKVRQEIGGCLDFERDIMPLLLNEMSVFYYLTSTQKVHGLEQAMVELERLKKIIEAGKLEDWLNQMQQNFGIFNPISLIKHNVSDYLSTSETYKQWFEDYLDKDITEARKGLAESPIKSALEAILAVREGIREAVDFGGLIESSWLNFFAKISPMINMNSIGPELLRIEEFLALIKAGIINISLGPNPIIIKKNNQKVTVQSRYWKNTKIQADLFCEAHLKTFELRQWKSHFIQSLLEKKFIQSNSEKYPGLVGAEVNEFYQAISKEFDDNRIWILGPMCEGSTYYNYYVPIKDHKNPSPPFLEAQKAVSSMLSFLDEERAVINKKMSCSF